QASHRVNLDAGADLLHHSQDHRDVVEIKISLPLLTLPSASAEGTFFLHQRDRAKDVYNRRLLPLRQTLILFLAAVAAGIINAVAGGGGFFSFPTLVFMGVPPVNANASGTVALWPGTLAATGAYWSGLKNDLRKVWPLAITSALGGLLGAILLLKT